MSNRNRNMAAIAGFLGLTFRVVPVILGVVNLRIAAPFVSLLHAGRSGGQGIAMKIFFQTGFK